MRIGPRYNMPCYDIVSSNGCALQWVESVRYLRVYFVKARQFKCRYDRATASFYRAFNAVFSNIGRSSSEEVVLQLINCKCMPCLLYAGKVIGIYYKQSFNDNFSYCVSRCDKRV